MQRAEARREHAVHGLEMSAVAQAHMTIHTGGLRLEDGESIAHLGNLGKLVSKLKARQGVQQMAPGVSKPTENRGENQLCKVGLSPPPRVLGNHPFTHTTDYLPDV